MVIFWLTLLILLVCLCAGIGFCFFNLIGAIVGGLVGAIVWVIMVCLQ